MSILIVEVVSEGLIFAADRNITVRLANGRTEQPVNLPKVLRWPRDDVLLGYVGAACLAGKPVPDWLQERKHLFVAMTSLEDIATTLADQVQIQRGGEWGRTKSRS